MGRWVAGGALAAWLTLLAPPLVLAAWLAGVPAWPAPLLVAPLAPIAFGIVMRALRGDSARARWLWMQAFGLGALLLPIVAVGIALRAALPAPTVGALVGIAWGVSAFLAHRAARRVHVERLALAVEGLSRPVRLAHLSDVHVGSRTPAFLAEVVERTASLSPELVLITGDLVDASDIAPDALAALDTLTGAGVPVYLSLGNHERYTDLARTIAAIEARGVRVLRDETLVHGPLRLTGIDDRERPDALPGILAGLAAERADGRPEVLLYHRPDGWAAAREAGVRLMLAGHTHGGQIWPFGLAVRRVYPDITGRFDVDGSTLYVSSGTGTWGPTFRLGTRSEMTLVELFPAAEGISSAAPFDAGTAR